MITAPSDGNKYFHLFKNVYKFISCKLSQDTMIPTLEYKTVEHYPLSYINTTFIVSRKNGIDAEKQLRWQAGRQRKIY